MPSCAPGDGLATVTVDKPTYLPGQPVHISASLQNVSGRTCNWLARGSDFAITNSSGAMVVGGGGAFVVRGVLGVISHCFSRSVLGGVAVLCLRGRFRLLGLRFLGGRADDDHAGLQIDRATAGLALRFLLARVLQPPQLFGAVAVVRVEQVEEDAHPSNVQGADALWYRSTRGGRSPDN